MAKQEKKAYKWLKRLVKRITQTDTPLNNTFDYYGYRIVQMSGTGDYTNVTVYDNERPVIEFSFDFLTKELTFESYPYYEVRSAVVEAFLDIYGEINISDELIPELKNDYKEIYDNPDTEIYTEEAVEMVKREMEIINNLPVGWVKKGQIND